MAVMTREKSRAVATVRSRGDWLTGDALQGREEARETIATGFKAIDALMPAGGLRRGSLVEWLAGGDAAGADVASGAGAVSLALAVACRLAKADSGAASGVRSADHSGRKTILVVDRGGWFYPPAVLPWLGDSRQLIVARPSHDDDEIWTIDQALRCRGVAAVVAWPRGATGHGTWLSNRSILENRQKNSQPFSQWTTAMRRWQLAARSSGCIGLFIRPITAASEPSWAEAKIAVSPLAGSPSLLGAPSLPEGTLPQRRLRLERIGGAWNGGLAGRATETVLDLARGCEGAIPRDVIRGTAWPRYREAMTDAPRSTNRGVSCRAS